MANYQSKPGKTPRQEGIAMQRFPEGMKTVAVSDCRVGEDLVFADDGNTW